MRGKLQQSLAALLTLLLLLALAPAGFAVDLSLKNTVTVTLTEDSDYAKDLKGAHVQVDLYLLAPAEADETSDSYSYKLPAEGTPFYAEMSKLIKDLDDAEKPEDQNQKQTVFDKFEPYAQAFAGIVLGSSYSGDPTRSESVVVDQMAITVSNLDAGLYLLLIRGSDLKTKDEDPETGYVKKLEQAASGEGAEADKILTTRVLTDDYEYYFRPQLLTVPTKVNDKNEQQYNTAYGEWSNLLTIYAKPTRDERNGDLKIIKNVLNPGPDPVAFVFQVSWTDKDGTVVTKYVTMVVEGKSREEYTLAKEIPVGTKVTVTEIGVGTGYAIVGDDTKIVEIKASQPAESGTADGQDTDTGIAEVEFTNDHTGPGGVLAVVNRFTTTEGGIEWKQYRDSAAADAAADSNG